MGRSNAISAAGIGVLLAVVVAWCAIHVTNTPPAEEREPRDAVASSPRIPRRTAREPLGAFPPPVPANDQQTAASVERKAMEEPTKLLSKEEIEAVAQEIALDIDREPSSVECDDHIKCEVRFSLDGEDLDYLESVITDSAKIRHPKMWMIPRDLQDREVTVYLMRRPMRLDELGYYFDIAQVESKLATGELEEPASRDPSSP